MWRDYRPLLWVLAGGRIDACVRVWVQRWLVGPGSLPTPGDCNYCLGWCMQATSSAQEGGVLGAISDVCCGTGKEGWLM